MKGEINFGPLGKMGSGLDHHSNIRAMWLKHRPGNLGVQDLSPKINCPSRDRGAWQVTVHGIAKSRTRLGN